MITRAEALYLDQFPPLRLSEFMLLSTDTASSVHARPLVTHSASVSVPAEAHR